MKNDCSTGADNKALVIGIDPSNSFWPFQLILATICCPNGKSNLMVFETTNNLSDNVMFVCDFSYKLEAFGSVKKTTLVERSKIFKVI